MQFFFLRESLEKLGRGDVGKMQKIGSCIFYFFYRHIGRIGVTDTIK